MSVLVNRQPKPKTRRASGTCRWVLPIGEVGTGVLAINGQSYTVTVHRDGGRVLGYRLEKLDGRAYDIDASAGEHWACDCPDATYRGRECKHVKALQAALRAAGK